MYNDQSNALGEFIFQSKYARYNSNLKRKETFEESVDRILQMHLKHLKDKYPEVYNKFVDLFMDTNFFRSEAQGEGSTSKKKEITTLAIPTDVETPEWVSEFIDYRTIINDNVGNFPVESVGIRRLGSNNINYSTIMKI